MSRIELDRWVAADPSSVALQVAGPDVPELWPGVRRVAGSAATGQLDVEVTLPDGRTVPVRVTVGPPARTPTAFVFRFAFVPAGFAPVRGSLSLAPALADRGRAGTRAVLRLDAPGFAGAALRAMAGRFLAGLAGRAEQRSSAA